VLRLHIRGHIPQQLLVLAEDLGGAADRDRVELVLLRSGGAVGRDRVAPIPGQQRGQVGDLVIGNPGQHVGKPSLGIDVVELGRLNQRQHDRGALAATIGAGEQPRLPASTSFRTSART
jgi:hypothetical protein